MSKTFTKTSISGINKEADGTNEKEYTEYKVKRKYVTQSDLRPDGAKMPQSGVLDDQIYMTAGNFRGYCRNSNCAAESREKALTLKSPSQSLMMYNLTLIPPRLDDSTGLGCFYDNEMPVERCVHDNSSGGNSSGGQVEKLFAWPGLESFEQF